MQQVNPRIAEVGIVVGYDGRHNSETWALLTAHTFISRGIKVYLHSRKVATPVLVHRSMHMYRVTDLQQAFSVLHLKTAAGVMVTASHNPKEDNGYKVYWDNGCQVYWNIYHGQSVLTVCRSARRMIRALLLALMHSWCRGMTIVSL